MRRRSAAAAGHSLRRLPGPMLAAFGAVSAVLQFVGQLFPGAFHDGGLVTAVSLGLCLLWGILRGLPRERVRHGFRHPEMSVTVQAGDLFDADAHLVVGFSDTFDTASFDGDVVSAESLQGQLLERRYGGDVARLDDEIVRALAAEPPAATEGRADKPLGKLDRYAIGTVAVLGARPRLVFAVAYSRLDNGGVASSSIDDLWLSLGRLWDAVHRSGQQGRVAMPLVGAGLARLDAVDAATLLRLIILSFVTRSRERRICRELLIVVRPEVLRGVDLAGVDAFLRSLGSESRGP